VGKTAGVTGRGTQVDLHALWVRTRRANGSGSEVVGLTTAGATSSVGHGGGVVGPELLRIRKKTEYAISHAMAFWCLSVRLSHTHGHQTRQSWRPPRTGTQTPHATWFNFLLAEFDALPYFGHFRGTLRWRAVFNFSFDTF